MQRFAVGDKVRIAKEDIILGWVKIKTLQKKFLQTKRPLQSTSQHIFQQMIPFEPLKESLAKVNWLKQMGECDLHLESTRSMDTSNKNTKGLFETCQQIQSN